MQAFALLIAASSLLLAQANIAFYWVNGFQTKNAGDKYYLSVTATTDKGYVSTSSSTAMPFDSKYNFTLFNADKYVTNMTATLYSYGSSAPVATYVSPVGVKLISNNFYILASTKSYDPQTGANVPKLTAVYGSTDPYAVTMSAYNFFWASTSGVSTAYYYPPSSYPMFSFPYGGAMSSILTSGSTSLYESTGRTYTSTSSSTLIYEKGASATHKFCTGSLCTSVDTTSYANSGQMFSVVYYGSYAYSQSGRMMVLTPPPTLAVH
jgi:hypothetical protein